MTQEPKVQWKGMLGDMCQLACTAVACAAALGYIPWGPELAVWLQVVFWFSIVLAAVLALLLVLTAVLWVLGAGIRVLLKLTESPKERRYWEAREAGEKRFRETFGPKT